MYDVYLIFTDGDIRDDDVVPKLIHQAAELAVSIIIVGVGNASFEIMHDLNRVNPQVVQFVNFNKHKDDPE